MQSSLHRSSVYELSPKMYGGVKYPLALAMDIRTGYSVHVLYD